MRSGTPRSKPDPFMSPIFRSRTAMLFALGSLLLAARSGAATHDAITAEGYQWQKDAWSLTCDNLRTCRLVYGKDAYLGAADGPHLNVTLLFTQAAGSAAMLPMEAKLIGADGEVESFEIERKWLDGDVQAAPDQPEVLLRRAAEAHTLHVRVRTSAGDREDLAVDLEGLKAVLLKLDDVQHRAGTPLALIATGTGSAATVLPPLAARRIKAGTFARATPEDAGIPPEVSASLLTQASELVKRLKIDGYCEMLDPPSLAISQDRWLLGQACTSGSGYNRTTHWWLGHAATAAGAPSAGARASLKDVTWTPLPIAGEFDVDTGDVVSIDKGRGIGDCMGSEAWTYSQEGKWELTERSIDGPCVGIPGGAWHLPTVTVEVERAAR